MGPDVRSRAARALVALYVGYLVGALVVGALLRLAVGPAASPAEDVVDLSRLFVAVGAVFVGCPAGTWAALRVAGWSDAAVCAVLAGAFSLAGVVVGEVLAGVTGLDGPEVSDAVRVAVIASPLPVVPLLVWLTINPRRRDGQRISKP